MALGMHSPISLETERHLPQWFLLAVQLFFLLVIWYLTTLSRLPSTEGNVASPIWPALGVALGASLVFGWRFLLLFFPVMFFWMLADGFSFLPSLLVASEQFLCAWTAYLLVRRYCDKTLIETLRGSIRFYCLVVLLVLLAFSLIDGLIYHAFGYYQGLSFVNVVAFNWLSEALGVALFAPLTQYLARFLVADSKWPALSISSIVLWLLFSLVVAGALLLSGKGHSNYVSGLSALFFVLVCWAAISEHKLSALTMLPGAVIVSLAAVYLSPLRGMAAWDALGSAIVFSVVLVLMGHLVLAASTEMRGMIQSLRESSRRDALTGEFNRSGLFHAYEQVPDEDKNHALLITLCIRNFDSSRDMLPESVLEQSQKWVAQQLRNLMELRRASFFLARIESGIFALLCNTSNEEAAKQLAPYLLDGVRGRRFELTEGSYRLEPAIGALNMTASTGLTEALATTRHLAQEAMHIPSSAILFGAGHQLLMQHREEMQRLEILKEAIAGNQFILYGQQIVPLQAQGKLKVELLIRMKSGASGVIPPGHFLPVASRFGYMVDVDRWVISNAFQQLSKRPDLLASVDVFSINLSGASMANPGLLSHIETCLADSGLKASHFCFEVTETEQIQSWDKANEILFALKQRGFTISLDDFGTGLASFDYLNRVAFDFVKIDGSFVKELSRENRNRQIIEAVVLVAKSRGIRTIAEFVETESERALLTDLQVDYAQGYVAHKPEPITDMQS